MQQFNNKSKRSWSAGDLTIFADPIHQYTPVTIPRDNECAEIDLIDSSWFQRLRSIGQLQMVKWVYPTAEHSRFIHCLGSMHIASRFINKLYPSLKKTCKKIKSHACVEETFRLAALLHDIGHGPFSHFFDHNYLNKSNITHEDIGAQIITKKLSKMIKKIKRSPSGAFARNERIDVKDITYLIKKGADGRDRGEWVRALKPLLTGIFTVDSLDYVLRDSYFTGLASMPADIERLVFYCSFRQINGYSRLCIHEHGLPALDVFLYTKALLYKCVYFHRTVRALEIHLRKVLKKTIDYYLKKRLRGSTKFTNYNWSNTIKIDELIKVYPTLTDASLIEFIKDILYDINNRIRYTSMPALVQTLIHDWRAIISRDPKWKEVFFRTLEFSNLIPGTSIISSDDFSKRIKKNLKVKNYRKFKFEPDVSTYDPRPELERLSSDERIYVIKNSGGRPSDESLRLLLEKFPLRIQLYRVFVPEKQSEKDNNIIMDAAKKALSSDLSDREQTSI